MNRVERMRENRHDQLVELSEKHNGKSLTLREIRDAWGLSNRRGVVAYLGNMEKAGYILPPIDYSSGVRFKRKQQVDISNIPKTMPNHEFRLGNGHGLAAKRLDNNWIELV